MLKNKKIILIPILALLISISIIGTVFATDLSETYRQVGTDWNTTKITYWLDFMGYSADSYYGTSAYYIRRTMDDDIIFVNCSGAEAGRMFCNTSGDDLTAEMTSYSNGLSLEYAFDSGDFNNMKLAYFCGDYTANDDPTPTPYDFGNLIEYAEYLGADCAVGWKDYFFLPYIGTFNDWFFGYLATGYNVSTCLYWAAYQTNIAHNGYHNTDEYEYEGNGSLTIN